MEQFNALRLSAKPGGLQQATLDADQLVRLNREAGKPVVFLLATDDLAKLTLAAIPGLVTDRGVKDSRRQLAYYFRKRTGVIRLQAVYAHAGLVERGLRDLIRSEDLWRGLICLIGLRPELFNELSKRAIPAASPSLPPIEAVPGYDEAALHEMLSDDSLFKPKDEDARRRYEAIAEGYTGSSLRIEWVRRLIWLAAQTRHPVLIQGESGTGKEIVAREIHACSARSKGPFQVLNCGAIPTELFESELFGHVKGAFSGALIEKEGYLATARDGVLFLDEIGDLLPQHQVKILRVIEGKKFMKVGSTQEIESNARFIAATHRDLAGLVQAGRFREDLYYRLFSIRIRTPALREHPEDIPELAQHFWRKINHENEQPVELLPQEIAEELAAYSWPGNARELRAALVNIAMVSGGRPVSLNMARAVMQDRRGVVPSRQGTSVDQTTRVDA